MPASTPSAFKLGQPALVAQETAGIFFQLLGAVEVMLMIVFVAGNITVLHSVLASNPGPSVVNRTAIVCPEVLAGIFDVQIPITVTDIDLRAFV